MKVTQICSSVLMSAALVHCGFFDTIADAVQGLNPMAPIEDMVAPVEEGSTQAILESVQSLVGDTLGDIPEQAAAAWASVLKDVPNGAMKLKDEMLAQATKLKQKQANKLKAATKGKGATEWMHVQDEEFPVHNLRVKSPKDLGVDKVKQYTGYLDVEEEDKHFFFWFFEARNDPENAPTVLWLNGGPGCSSLTGLFFELGPSSIGPEIKPVHNKWAWNNNANVIFLDQPVNTGYSYSSGTVSDTVTAGKDAYAFLQLFFKKFPEYATGEFHIAGESYAGHYIPVFGAEIASHDDKRFNLTSLMIGNGLTDPLRQYDLYEPMACGGGGHKSVLEPEQCDTMISKQPRCNQLIESCYNSQSAWLCVPAAMYCNTAAMGPYQETGLNVYDIRENCTASENGLCYAELDFMEQYLNLPEVQEAIGAEVETYKGCNTDVNMKFLFNGDWMMPYYTAVADLLEQEIPILIYAGDKDFICNWLGNEAWSRALPWSGQEEFAATELTPWVVDGKEAGMVRNYEHFTFLRVYEAGHMVPFNQPKNALDMFERWIGGDFTYA